MKDRRTSLVVDPPDGRIPPLDAPMYEYACHEGNFRSVVGMLNGTLAQEKFK